MTFVAIAGRNLRGGIQFWAQCKVSRLERWRVAGVASIARDSGSEVVAEAAGVTRVAAADALRMRF